jgi:hypothetical protein
MDDSSTLHKKLIHLFVEDKKKGKQQEDMDGQLISLNNKLIV